MRTPVAGKEKYPKDKLIWMFNCAREKKKKLGITATPEIGSNNGKKGPGICQKEARWLFR